MGRKGPCEMMENFTFSIESDKIGTNILPFLHGIKARDTV